MTVEAFDTPARIRPEHVVLNPEAAIAVQRYAVKDDSPLGVAYSKGRLESGRHGYTGRDRYEAGLSYRAIWDTVHGSGCGGLNPNRVSGGTSEPRSSESLCIARQLLKRIHERMSKTNAYLVMCFIGEGSTGSDAVKAHISGFELKVWAAICMALDDLVDAVLAQGIKRAA